MSQLKGGLFGEKLNFRKISQCRKTERGLFGIFKHPMCCEISKKLKGGHFGDKKTRKKVSQCRKTERGSLWGFSIPILSQNIKKLKWGNFFVFRTKTFHSPEKKLKGGTLRGFPTSILTHNSKKIEGGHFGENFSEKKSRSTEKKLKTETLRSRPVWYVTRKNRKTFLVQIARPNGAIWCNNILFRTLRNCFGQFVWIEKKRKTTLIVAFHFMKRRLKIGEVNMSHFVSSEICHEITVWLVAGKSGNLPVYILRELTCISSDLIKLISSPMPLLVSLSQSFVPSE